MFDFTEVEKKIYMITTVIYQRYTRYSSETKKSTMKLRTKIDQVFRGYCPMFDNQNQTRAFQFSIAEESVTK